ncbi:MAG: integrase core domain-containing protein, partial [Bdellovibrionales bacterium]|nr:integrase core domain-containing protein [Bdellovibrionales bacterium]
MVSLLHFISSILIFILRLLFSSKAQLEKENLLLRHQLKVLKKSSSKRPQFNWLDRLLFVMASNKSLKSSCVIFRPETLYKWHRGLVRKKMTYGNIRPPGRPRTKEEIEELILRLKQENRLWGVPRIHGELLKLRIRISQTTVRNILKRHGLNPDRSPESYLTWSQFLKQHKNVWAIDFFTVETVLLKTVYVFVILDVHTRKLIELRTCSIPLKEWTRNTLLHNFGFENAPDLIIRDGAGNYGNMDNVGGVKVVKIPPGCPWFNTHVERFNGSAQRECTDHFLYFSQKQIQKTLDQYKEYYNHHRPHQTLFQFCPIETGIPPQKGNSFKKIESNEILEGLH